MVQNNLKSKFSCIINLQHSIDTVYLKTKLRLICTDGQQAKDQLQTWIFPPTKIRGYRAHRKI